MISKIIFKAIKPFRLASLLTTYLMGAGLVQYVRNVYNWEDSLTGGLFLMFVVITIELLRVNQHLQDPKNWPEKSSANEIRRTRWIIALIIATFSTAAVTIFIDWMVGNTLRQGLTLLVIGFLIVYLIYFLSYFYKKLRPFNILFELMLFVIIPPALAFFIQSSESHRLLTQVVIGFMPAFLSYRLLTQLKTYHRDLQTGTLNSVTYVGWEKAMVLHNALILLTYLIFASIALIGFPWFLLWPVFLTLPIGLVEIWLMERVHRGAKPLWKVMRFATLCVFFLPLYLLSFAFWIR